MFTIDHGMLLRVNNGFAEHPSGLPTNYVAKGYAVEFDATLVTLEHRFYGMSLPYTDFR